jgi:hypothetical protein
MTKTHRSIDDYRDRLKWLASDLTEANASRSDDRDQINADIAWVEHAINCYDDDPLEMAYSLANRTNFNARRGALKDLADNHTRSFQKQARKGYHYLPG